MMDHYIESLHPLDQGAGDQVLARTVTVSMLERRSLVANHTTAYW